MRGPNIEEYSLSPKEIHALEMLSKEEEGLKLTDFDIKKQKCLIKLRNMGLIMSRGSIQNMNNDKFTITDWGKQWLRILNSGL